MNARNELLEEEQKWFREREQLRSEYESGMSSTQASTSNSDQLEDMKTELKNIRELNSNYEKTIKQQKTLIEDLKEDLKRKK